MDDESDNPAEVTIGEYQILVGQRAPLLLEEYRRHAEWADDFPAPDDGTGDSRGAYAFVAVRDNRDWPALVVTQRYAPATGGFAPGILLVAEQRQVFIGAGTRLLAYDARSGMWRRTWADTAEYGFWGWRRHHDVVVMSAELELAAWSLDGTKRWTTFVEPPWSYRVRGDELSLDVMGTVRTFNLHCGP